jgi:hypothetical protein
VDSVEGDLRGLSSHKRLTDLFCGSYDLSVINFTYKFCQCIRVREPKITFT